MGTENKPVAEEQKEEGRCRICFEDKTDNTFP